MNKTKKVDVMCDLMPRRAKALLHKYEKNNVAQLLKKRETGEGHHAAWAWAERATVRAGRGN